MSIQKTILNVSLRDSDQRSFIWEMLIGQAQKAEAEACDNWRNIALNHN